MSVDGMVARVVDGITIYNWRVFEPWNNKIRTGITTKLNELDKKHQPIDQKSADYRNRAAVAGALGVPTASWARANQVHGISIADAESCSDEPFDSCDAICVSKNNIIAAILLADCHPVAVYDPVRNSGVICHAGWKGTASGIAVSGVQHLINSGSRVEDLIAAAGPGIGPCCYPVGREVADRFEDRHIYPETVVVQDADGRYRLDLEEANLARLRAAGIQEDQLGRGGFCTACRSEEFHSHRKEKGLTARQVAVMVLL